MHCVKTKMRLCFHAMTPKGNISELVQVMKKLLAPDGCPWDREQTHQSLAPFAIEEAHELAEALEKKDIPNMKEELGDLLLQVVFHSELAEKSGTFTLDDVVRAICDKLVFRHPHVFGDAKVKDAGEVLENWEVLKKQEKKKDDPMDIPKGLPALQRAQKIGSRTKDLKFDWSSAAEVMEKVDEEMQELKAAMASKDLAHTEEELGDVMFVLAQLARHLKLEAETVARKANTKFIARFNHMLEKTKKNGLEFKDLSLDEKEKLWIDAKRALKKS